MFTFRVIARKGFARVGIMKTPHGEIHTPVFMPVGTQGSVKALSPEDLEKCGVEIILGNTYHLYLRPGEKVIRTSGGLHEFMKWRGPMLTDSGGYQVSSLGYFLDPSSTLTGFRALRARVARARLRGAVSQRVKPTKIDEVGVTFYSHLDGSKHRLTPEKSIEIQENLGADIIMAFDEATPDRGKRYAREAMERTHKWLKRSIKRWRELEEAKFSRIRNLKTQRTQIDDDNTERLHPQALFGIIQGGNYRDLRRESGEFVISQGLPGIAIGGGSIGKDPEETAENVDWIRDLLPKNKPVYLMGVGVNPEDVIAAIEAGGDMFDCVAPTRLARMGHLYHGKLKIEDRRWNFESEFDKGRMNIGNARFKLDKRPIQEGCDCYTCQQGFSRAYLNHLFQAKELLYYRLASIHNVRFMVRLTKGMRRAILAAV